MSSYFDAASHEIYDSAAHPPEQFVAKAKEVEARVIKDIREDISDYQFPEDLRAAIQKNINTHSLETEKGMEWFLMLHYSELIEKLHENYHDLARRRLEVRHGRLMDSPTYNVFSRKEYEKENQQ